MSMLTVAKTLIGGTVAGLTLLALTANPSFADTHKPTAAPTTASSTNETPVAQNSLNQTAAPTNQTPQQPTQGGCSCCKNMMSNMPGMMKNMPGMTGNQSNPSR